MTHAAAALVLCLVGLAFGLWLVGLPFAQATGAVVLLASTAGIASTLRQEVTRSGDGR